MASLSLVLSVDMTMFRAFVESLGTALTNAHCDVNCDVSVVPEGIAVDDATIARFGRTKKRDGRHILPLQPTVGMALFAGRMLEALPERATIEWVDGWPIFHCSPRDDREDDEPTEPMAPEALTC